MILTCIEENQMIDHLAKKKLGEWKKAITEKPNPPH